MVEAATLLFFPALMVFAAISYLLTLIILSSPAMGGHYFIDVIAGIILAALTISLPGYVLSGIWRLKKNIRHTDAPVFASK